MAKLHMMAVLAGCLWSGCAWAADGGLSWQDCDRLAASNSPVLRATEAQAAISQAGVKVARSALFPQLVLGASAGRSHQDTDVTGTRSSYRVVANLEQSLYTGGKNQAAVRSARSAVDKTRAAVGNTLAEISCSLRNAFVDLLYAQRQVDLLQAIERRRADNLELVDLRYEGGREHKGSLALSRASLNDAQVQIRQARRRVEVNRQVLQRTMGWTCPWEGLTVTGDLRAAQAPAAGDVESLARRTPACAETMAAVEAARAQVDAARSGFRPQVGLSGSAGRFGDDDAFDNEDWSLGLSLTFPLWLGGRASHEMTQAVAALAEAEAQWAAKIDAEVRRLEEERRIWADAVEQVAVQQTYVEAADLRAEIARRQYEDGLLTFENWSLIEDDRISRQKQYLDAEQTALHAEAAWWLLVGRNEFSSLYPEGEGIK